MTKYSIHTSAVIHPRCSRAGTPEHNPTRDGDKEAKLTLTALTMWALKFCFFVAISIWKPVMAVSCTAFFHEWGCALSSARINLMFWRVCQSVSHRTGVDIYCTLQSLILACYVWWKLFNHILILSRCTCTCSQPYKKFGSAKKKCQEII